MHEATLTEFLEAYPPEIRALAMETRSLILRVIPDVIEIVDSPSKIIAYGTGRKYADLICAIAPYPGYINLMFSNGAVLPDPHQLLAGTGKRARHLKLRTLEDIQSPATQELIEGAVAMHSG